MKKTIFIIVYLFVVISFASCSSENSNILSYEHYTFDSKDISLKSIYNFTLQICSCNKERCYPQKLRLHYEDNEFISSAEIDYITIKNEKKYIKNFYVDTSNNDVTVTIYEYRDKRKVDSIEVTKAFDFILEHSRKLEEQKNLNNYVVEINKENIIYIFDDNETKCSYKYK